MCVCLLLPALLRLAAEMGGGVRRVLRFRRRYAAVRSGGVRRWAAPWRPGRAGPRREGPGPAERGRCFAVIRRRNGPECVGNEVGCGTIKSFENRGNIAQRCAHSGPALSQRACASAEKALPQSSWVHANALHPTGVFHPNQSQQRLWLRHIESKRARSAGFQSRRKGSVRRGLHQLRSDHSCSSSSTDL